MTLNENYGASRVKTHYISILAENRSGVLSRITGLFARRNFNITSLTVGETHRVGVSRITIAAKGDDVTLEQIKKQLNKLIDVITVRIAEKENTLFRELIMIKVRCGESEKRQEIFSVAQAMNAKISDISRSTLTIEFTENTHKINELLALIDSESIIEMVRTGVAAIKRGEESIEEYKK